jgi:diaminopimelate decarboxylase
MKSNSNLAILKLFASEGGGVDIVSGGELYRALKAGVDPAKIVFSGVGKKVEDLAYALESDILMFNVESPQEILKLDEVAKQKGKKARIAFRVNPDVDPKTHPYISTGLKENKFGIDIQQAEAVYQRAAELLNITVQGIDCHIGSQLTDTAPFVDALDRVLMLIDALAAQGIVLQHIDVGGGLGITYDDETPPSPVEYAQAILAPLKKRNLEIILEPGRAIAGNAGVLLTRVEYLKPGDEKNFAIVDAAMNDLLRPALYGAWQNIIPLQQRESGEATIYDVVGPICETGDFIGKERELNIEPGDVLAVCSAGAYGFGMGSNYNSRPRAAEVMVDGDEYHVVREREAVEDLYRGESVLPK